MAEALRNLNDISTGYSIFERDQVLTETQLNSVSSYLDDQERLTRVSLAGVGIVCGLQVSLNANRMTLSRGVGVTTDGDLVRMAADTVYNRFRPYPTAAPPYDPFGLGQARIPLYELIQEGARVEGAVEQLSSFGTSTQRTLSGMVAVLLMESQVVDKDQCSGTDCDNLGRNAVHTPRLLLIDRSNVSRLKESFSTPDRAVRNLSEVVADRPSITSAASLNDLAGVYRTACTRIVQSLETALPRVYQYCSGFISDLFSGDPTAGWMSRLTSLQTSYAGTGTGIQYYYGFLKDVVETYNDFRGLLFGETTVCCPDVGAFPKHLLLGGLAGSTAEDRTGYYPSPAATTTSERLRHARFLATKLNTLIHTFSVPGGTSLPVRITPSLFEDRCLEERAIPFYYAVNTTLPIHRSWSYERRVRGSEAGAYSYNAASYGAQGAAASPLTVQLGRFPFFRIEGHLGANADTVMTELQRQIRERNLPFVVRSIMLGTDRTRLPRRRKRYTDLHRMHYLVRNELAQQMEEVASFSGRFKDQVLEAVKGNVIRDQPDDTQGMPIQSVTQFTNEKHGQVFRGATEAQAQLTKGYADYRQNKTAVKQHLQSALQGSGEFKYYLGSAVKTEFSTPFDAFIGNMHYPWLDWLDDVIIDWENSEDDKLLFNKFLTEHPGAEHFAGVLRGGTFVLVHDTANTVVADFMLPYYCPEPPEQEAAERPLPKVPRPDIVVKEGVRIRPPREKYVKDHLDIFRTDFEPKVKEMINPLVRPLEDYFRGIKESLAIIASPTKETLPGGTIIPGNYLDMMVRELDMRNLRVDFLRNQLLEPGISETVKAQLRTDLGIAQKELAAAVTNTAKAVASGATDVAVGSDAYKALTAAGQSMMKLDSSVLTSTKDALAKVSTTGKPQLGAVLTNIRNLKGR